MPYRWTQGEMEFIWNKHQIGWNFSRIAADLEHRSSEAVKKRFNKMIVDQSWMRPGVNFPKPDWVGPRQEPSAAAGVSGAQGKADDHVEDSEQATEISSHPEDYWSDERTEEDPAGERLADKKGKADKVGSVKQKGADGKTTQALQGKLEALEAENKTLKTDKKTLETDYKALETDRNALKARYQSERAEFRSRIKALEEELEIHKQAVAGCRGFLRSLP